MITFICFQTAVSAKSKVRIAGKHLANLVQEIIRKASQKFGGSRIEVIVKYKECTCGLFGASFSGEKNSERYDFWSLENGTITENEPGGDALVTPDSPDRPKSAFEINDKDKRRAEGLATIKFLED